MKSARWRHAGRLRREREAAGGRNNEGAIRGDRSAGRHDVNGVVPKGGRREDTVTGVDVSPRVAITQAAHVSGGSIQDVESSILSATHHQLPGECARGDIGENGRASGT